MQQRVVSVCVKYMSESKLKNWACWNLTTSVMMRDIGMRLLWGVIKVSISEKLTVSTGAA